MSFPYELGLYVARIREFSNVDWRVYVGWVGLMLGLVLATGGFLIIGHLNGVSYPAEAWWVPLGALIFAVSISLDTIGHRTIYKNDIAGAEGLVHGITIFCGISSSVLLCAAYSHPSALWIPALVLTILSFIYSFVDEALHFRRYLAQKSDRVEMWSHVGILVGHASMMTAWWAWFLGGYQGVAQTLLYL